MDNGFTKVADLAAAQDWLAILTTWTPGADPAQALVNAAIVDHPVTGARGLAFVSRGRTRKLRNLRANPRATLTFRNGWDWVAVTGAASVVGPDDPMAGFDPAGLPGLLRAIYAAAGGSHSDLAEYDREMVADRRAAVFVAAERFVSNPGRHDRE